MQPMRGKMKLQKYESANFTQHGVKKSLLSRKKSPQKIKFFIYKSKSNKNGLIQSFRQLNTFVLNGTKFPTGETQFKRRMFGEEVQKIKISAHCEVKKKKEKSFCLFSTHQHLADFLFSLTYEDHWRVESALLFTRND